MPLTIPIEADPRTSINAPLKNAADEYEMNVNGGVTPVPFYYTVNPPFKLLVTSFLVVIADVKIDPGDFGGQPALTNGLELLVTDSTGKKQVDVFGGIPVKRNLDLAFLTGIDFKVDRGAKSEVLIAELTLASSNIVTSIYPGFSVVMTVRDDLSLITSMECRIKGFLYR